MHLKIKSTLLLLFLGMTIYAQEYSGKGEDINKILNNIDSFSKACLLENHDKLTSLYSKDGKIFPAGEDIKIGHHAIKKRWKLSRGMKLISHKVTPREIRIIDDYAYDYGYYAMTIVDKKGRETPSKGNYMIIWKKTDDDWKIYLDIWNRIDKK
jgi:ketosteroid isomerase-like protein